MYYSLWLRRSFCFVPVNCIAIIYIKRTYEKTVAKCFCGGVRFHAPLWAEHDSVASPADLDTALQYGVNYPRGLLAWREAIDPERASTLLRALDASVADDRFLEPC